MKKKLLAMALIATMVFVLTACGGGSNNAKPAEEKTEEAAASDWVWERNIEIICPWGTGGGADTTLRAFTSALEKELGVKVTVNNVTGAGGVTGTQFATEQPADGYTYVMNTQSPMLAQISGATDFDVVGNINPLCQMVHDVNIFVAGIDEPYNTLEELWAYLDENPGSVKCGVMAITGLDNACVQGAFDGKVEPIAYEDGSQLNGDIIGGHVNLGCEGPAEVSEFVQSGKMKVIGVCAENRLTLEGFENAQTTVELGNDTTYGPARGIFYLNGTPEEAIAAFEAAAEKAWNSDEFQEFMKTQSLDQRQGWKNREEYTAAYNKDYEELNALFGSN